MRLKLIVFVFFIFSIHQSLAFVTVGASGCDETTINAALTLGDSEIRLVKGNFTPNLPILNGSIEIIGGYDSCAAASANTPPTEKTFIYADAAPGPSVIKINLNNSEVILRNLYITGGRKDASVFNGGHGIEVGGSSGSVFIFDSSIVDNRSDKGGGLYVSGNSAADNKYISIKDSVIFGNNALGFSTGNGFGGGIYCGGEGSSVYINGESQVTSNFAENGGGIAAEFGCFVRVSSGIDVNSSADKRGIMNNQATINGGGVYLNDNAYLSLSPTVTGGKFGVVSSSTTPATLASNSAGQKGGGVYAQLNSIIEIRDSIINNNTATDGGGFYTTTNTRIHIDRSGLDCWNIGSCVEISENMADNGGVLYMSLYNDDSVSSNILHANIFGNRADSGIVGYLTGFTTGIATSIYMNSSLIHNNGNLGSNGYSDFNLFSISNNAEIRMEYVTIADNDIKVNGEVLRSIGSSFYILNSIVYNNVKVIVQFTTLQSILNCLVVNEENSFMGTNIFVEDPGFVNSGINDYHLSSTSFATDLCDRGFATGRPDAEYDSRGIDILSVMNIGGPYDAGADEYNDFEAVFKNGFE